MSLSNVCYAFHSLLHINFNIAYHFVNSVTYRNSGYVSENGVNVTSQNSQLSLLCKICFDQDPSALFLPCRHICACLHCAAKVDKCSAMLRSIRVKKVILSSSFIWATAQFITMDVRSASPFTCVVSNPTGSGKTEFESLLHRCF